MNPRQLRQRLLLIITALLGIGLVAVYSASAIVSQNAYGDSFRFVTHHVIGIGVGLAASLACLMIPFPAIRASSRWLYLVSLVLTILVFLVGQEVGGARRWFRIGGFGIQPSELAQLSLALYLADFLARKGPAIQEFRRGLLPALMATGLAAGIVLIQPDLGTAVAMGLVALLLLGVAKARWQHLVGVVVLAVVALVVLIASAEYRRRRILAYLDPWHDPLGVGYQILQSYFALAGGGLIGEGIGASLQKLFYLPSAHTDFIFAIIGEELGLIGSTLVLGLFGLFMTIGFRIAVAAQDLFSKYLVCGLVGMIGFQAVVNMAVVIGLLPTKGLPLPFISYGGSSMVMNLVACALVFQASKHGERIHPAQSAVRG